MVCRGPTRSIMHLDPQSHPCCWWAHRRVDTCNYLKLCPVGPMLEAWLPGAPLIAPHPTSGQGSSLIFIFFCSLVVFSCALGDPGISEVHKPVHHNKVLIHLKGHRQLAVLIYFIQQRLREFQLHWQKYMQKIITVLKWNFLTMVQKLYGIDARNVIGKLALCRPYSAALSPSQEKPGVWVCWKDPNPNPLLHGYLVINRAPFSRRDQVLLDFSFSEAIHHQATYPVQGLGQSESPSQAEQPLPPPPLEKKVLPCRTHTYMQTLKIL